MPVGRGLHPGTHGPTYGSLYDRAKEHPKSLDIEDRRDEHWAITNKMYDVSRKIDRTKIGQKVGKALNDLADKLDPPRPKPKQGPTYEGFPEPKYNDIKKDIDKNKPRKKM